MNTIIPKIALSKLHGFGPVRIAQLISKMGGIEEIFTASLNEIYMQTGFSKSLLREIKREEALLFAEKEVKDIYIGIYCSIVTLVAFFYLYNRNVLREIKDIFIYTNDIKSIFLRLIYVYILMYIMFYK